MSGESARPGAPGFLVGKIIRPHGGRGAVIVEEVSDNPERFRRGSPLMLRSEDDRPKEVCVEACARWKGRLVLHLSGVETAEDARRLEGSELMIPAELAAPLAEGEYWVHELAGMAVRDEQGNDLGEVTDVVARGEQDTLVIESTNGEEYWVPFVREFVKEVDRDSSTLTVRLIEGLGPGRVT